MPAPVVARVFAQFLPLTGSGTVVVRFVSSDGASASGGGGE